MKKYTLLFSLVLVAGFCNAQRLDIFGGINSTGFNHKINGVRQDNSGNINVLFGMGVFVPFNPKSYKSSEDGNGLFPTLAFVKKGTSKSTVVGTTEADVKVNYLQLTLPLAYVGGNYGIGFGPYAAYAMSGSKKYRVGSNTGKQDLDFSKELNRLDYGLSINMTLSLFKLQYDLGLANIGTGVNTVKTRSFSMSLNIPIVQ